MPVTVSMSATRTGRHAALLAGVSVAAMFMANPQAYAKPMGGHTPTASAAAIAAAQNGSQEAARAARKAQNSLKRATMAIQAMQATQAAARDAARAALRAMPSGIPNGLRPGGLQQATGPNAIWIGANAPTEATEGDRTKVNIEQTQKNAILTWQTYNVSENTDLRYDQKGNRDWVALNRVLDPSLAPSKILGTIKGDGTVLVINQNGIVFGAGAQINVGSLIASSYDVGSSIDPMTLAQRNARFLQYGVLGFADSQAENTLPQFSRWDETGPIGDIKVEKGALVSTKDKDGLILMMAPHVINAGHLSAPAGQVLLSAGVPRLTRATGAADSLDPNVRGLFVSYEPYFNTSIGNYVWNQADGLIEANQGNITLATPNNTSRDTGQPAYQLVPGGAVINDGVLSSTTSVARNGSITISGGDIRLSSSGLLSIAADASGETIPQDPTSLAGFKPSQIKIGNSASNIEMQSDAFIYAPSGNVIFGAPGGASANTILDNQTPWTPSIFIDSGAVIDVAGLMDVLIPATRNQVVISPAKKNELRDSPLYRDGFLNGATLYLDPRLSGVRADGVAWIGSPLIDAASYYQLVGVSSAELMTKGGNVTFGAVGYRPNGQQPVSGFNAASVIVKSGAVIDVSGGWVTYGAGKVQTTQLVDSFGRIVDIGRADPNQVYIGIYGGWTRTHARWGVSENWTSLLKSGRHYETEYNEGRDAGSLTIKTNAAVFDGTIYGQAFAGERQRAKSKTGSGKSAVYGDGRAVQGATNELPSGGFLFVQTDNGGGDIRVVNDRTTLPDSFAYGKSIDIAPDGSYTAPVMNSAGVLSGTRLGTVEISSSQINNTGLSAVSLYASGGITVEADANVRLNSGSVFSAFAGRKIQIDGDISAAGGKILLETYNGVGSIFVPAPVGLGSYDIVVNGTLSVAGRWINDFGAQSGSVPNKAWMNGGTIAMYAASSIAINTSATASLDISGSILINNGAKLVLTGGGRVDEKGRFDLTAKGGNLSLGSDTGYFQVALLGSTEASGWRVPNITFSGTTNPAINPDRINARISFDPNSIEAHGFAGGGTFTLKTPEFNFGTGTPTVGTVLPLDFFATAGFATYNITSLKTDLRPNTFTNGYGGYNAVLATQTLTVGAGQTLSLVQSVLPNILDGTQAAALRNLASGGDVRSVVAPTIPDSAWDAKGVSLNFGGLIELHVAQGGKIAGAVGSSLSASKLLNEGTIRLPGGTITQQEILPSIYWPTGGAAGVGIRHLSDVFSVAADGSIDPNGPNRLGIIALGGGLATNAEVAGDYRVQRSIYFLGLLDQDQGMVLAPGSVTDLSGEVTYNPRTVAVKGRTVAEGWIVAGGTLASPVAQQLLPDKMFRIQRDAVGAESNPVGALLPRAIIAQPGAVLDLSGAAGAFGRLERNGLQAASVVSVPVWSSAGSLIAANGGTFTGAIINAHGGAPQAAGGVLQIANPVFVQHDPSVPAANVISADMIANAGFETLSAIGSITSIGDATIHLRRGFLLEGNITNGVTPKDGISGDPFIPVIKSGGVLQIDAGYIGIRSSTDLIKTPGIGTAASGSVLLNASMIDIAGALIFDRSVANASLRATGDIRLTGVPSWDALTWSASPTLMGELAVNGNLSLIAAQVYPSTGSTYTISSTAANGTITFGRSGAVTPPTPYSAGGNLSVYAANIVQGGVIRIPFGRLTLGSNTAYTKTANSITTTFAPATQSVTLLDGSITGVSANGLVIPYGTSTDQKEWFFSPTGLDPLAAPPAKILSISGASIAMNSGATVDPSGGGDVYAYEFVPGTGGSRDVLDRMNPDVYSGNKGFQYPDGRQVYAIVPSLSDAPVAVRDPLYSVDYSSLYSIAGAGKRVYLDAAPGLAAGWYTLLPAKYATLPGGMRVVEQIDASGVRAGSALSNPDGSLIVSGYFGDGLSGTAESQIRLFSVESQSVILQKSNIVLTSGSATAIAQAAKNGGFTPSIGADAGRLVLNPVNVLQINTAVSGAAAAGGRGSQVDISGTNIEIRSNFSGLPSTGSIQLTADSLTNLNAASLLIGGVRTDNADGSTSLLVSAQSILVANDAAHPLSAQEIVLVVDDLTTNPVASNLTLADGAAVIATGSLVDRRDGNYLIDGRIIRTTVSTVTTLTNPKNAAIGALFRVANGPERLVQRLRDVDSVVVPAASLTVGAITASGTSIGFDTSNDLSVATNATLRAASISIGAPAIAFTSATSVPGAVVLTPQLQTALSQGDHLTLHAQTIGFDDGSYRFGATTFDTQLLVSRQGGAVALTADDLSFSNRTGPAVAVVGGAGVFNITADTISFNSGAVATSRFGGGVNLTSTKGLFATGTDALFDVGGAALTVHAPYLGDTQKTRDGTEQGYGLTLKSTGTVNITSVGLAAIDLTRTGGVPGSSITILGDGVTISGTRVHATAGSVAVKSSGDIVLANGAILEAPGYSKTFGDSADPVVRYAAGGAVTLAAQGAGGIALGDAMLSVGGSNDGNAGKLSFSTPNGAVDFGSATLDGRGKGGVFALDTQGAVDLVTLNNRVAALGFNGGFDIRTRTGDIDLAAGQVLRSGSVRLTADGGFVTVAGMIDTSGVNGGDIALYGTKGVTLQLTAKLDAHADGYAADDTRRARAGTITLGTDFIRGSAITGGDGSVSGTSGAVKVTAGALLDVSARRPGDRLVRLMRNGTVYYQYVEADQGGAVNFRAPVYVNNGNQTVNVAVDQASSIVGARSVAIEGFKRWDLAAVAGSGLYSGVTFNSSINTVTLDVTTGLDTANANGTLTTVAGLNFLGDKGAGTVVEFVQGFDISSMYGNLGGLAAQSNFRARPGLDLDATGDIVLASNWNLGAGTVDLTSALAAGYMRFLPVLQVAGKPTTGYVVKSGFEDEVFASNTKLIYRTDNGSVSGEAPVVSLRAGGALTLKGSLTDGFFLFRDQTDETYLNKLGANGGDNYVTLNGGMTSTSALTQWSAWLGTTAPIALGLTVGSASTAYTPTYIVNTTNAPYSAVGNSPAALGTFVADTPTTGNINGGGDPLASAVVFPLLTDGTSAASSSYALVAGAAGLSGGSIGSVSADPSRFNPGSSAALTFEGGSTTYQSLAGSIAASPIVAGVRVDSAPAFSGTVKPLATTGDLMTVADWLAHITGTGFPNVSDTSVATLYIGATGADPNRALIQSLFTAFATAHGLVLNSSDPEVGWRRSAPTATDANTTFIAMSVKNFKLFVTEKLIPNLATIEANLKPRLTALTSTAVVVGRKTLVQNLIRTGTGSIGLMAAGDVDLRGTPTVRYLDRMGLIAAAPVNGTNPPQQIGGPAIYTAGARVAPSSKTVVDPVSGASVTIDPPVASASVFAAPMTYNYGRAVNGGAAGVMLADPLYLENGGDIVVAAGNDVLGRRDRSLQISLSAYVSSATFPWIGSGDQPWRVGTIGNMTRAAINPQLFREGLGSLGGGNIVVSAGRDVSDISTVADNSLLTAIATPANGVATKALLSFGGGNVVINAERDIAGGRLDVASGMAALSAGRNVTDGVAYSSGARTQRYVAPDGTSATIIEQVLDPNRLRVRISDAAVDIDARGSVVLQGIAALGAVSGGAVSTDIYGFYSPYAAVNLLANGTASITNARTPFTSGGSAIYVDLLGGDGVGSAYVYPGSLRVVSMASDIDIRNPTISGGSSAIAMMPSPLGQLQLLAAGNIAPVSIAMLDSDLGQLPGMFSTYAFDGVSVSGGVPFGFPSSFSSMSDYARSALHNSLLTHANDKEPVYVYAGNDIGDATKGVSLWLPKQARIAAGRDILNMMFFGQNLAEDDITRIVAGQDITGTSKLTSARGGVPLAAMQGNTFLIGGPGTFFLEAGRDLGPFLNSAVSLNEYSSNGVALSKIETMAGGIISVGNDWNPYLSEKGADLNVLFGVGKGANYLALRDSYVAPGSSGHALGDYGAKLLVWMRQNAESALLAQFGTVDVSIDDAYAVFVTLPELRQRTFLIREVYFNELRAPAVTGGPSYLKYSRGYTAVNTLFPASLGYTANSLEGGASDAAIVRTGDLDLRLAAIETLRSGDINILGPGGRVLAGSVVATSQQAARRTYNGFALYAGSVGTAYGQPNVTRSIPPGYEGVLTLRGGTINTFTDGDFLLNQSRLFTVQGGDITMWSSNADLNAGQGAKTTANFPPLVVRIDQNMVVEGDQAGATTGAGIAALPPAVDVAPPDVYLLAPRGAVDAGDAGVRSAGNLSVAALRIVNADNFKVSGAMTGIPNVQAPNIGGLTEASNTAGAAAQQASTPSQGSGNAQPSIIIVEVLGFGGGTGEEQPDSEQQRSRGRQSSNSYDTNNVVRLLGNGTFTAEDTKPLTTSERDTLASQVVNPGAR